MSQLGLVLTMVTLTAAEPLIPRRDLFGPVGRSNPLLSPDGKHLASVAPDSTGQLQLWVRALEAASDRQLSSFTSAFHDPRWSKRPGVLLYEQDTNGDENGHVFSLELETGASRDLTPWPGVRAQVLAISVKRPNEILVTANRRDPKVMDVWRVPLDGSAPVLEVKNPGDVDQWAADGTLQVRVAVARTAEGHTQLRVRESSKSKWQPFVEVGLEERVAFVDFTDDGRAIIIESSINAETTQLLEKDLTSGAERVLVHDPHSDVRGTLGYGSKRGARAAAFEREGRQVWVGLEPSLTAELEQLASKLTGQLGVLSMDDADSTWVVSEERDVAAPTFWLWRRQTKTLEPLFSGSPTLASARLSPMQWRTFRSRDGLTLPTLVTVPAGVSSPAPAVLLVHGGPWAHDRWGFNAETQWLANRGYVVVQVNFRGSTGYGKRFVSAGDRQWGLAMQDDLLEVLDALISEGTVDARRVGIMGQSYGGYAALSGLAFSPKRFACGVSLVGPSSLLTLLQSTPPYWAAFRKVLNRRVGDPGSSVEASRLTKVSPLFSASSITAPVFIAQGARDPRVKQAESEQMVAALEKAGRPVTYVLYQDEGHGLSRFENRLDFYGRVETFLAGCLGGRAEPFAPIEGTSARVGGR